MFNADKNNNWTEIANVDNRSDLMYIAKLAEQSERYDDMALVMKRLVEKGGELSDEERNLLSLACKNVIGSRRKAWRVISRLEKRSKGNPTIVKYVSDYRMKIENELQEMCDDVFKLLKDCNMKSDTQPESSAFFLKMEGDYYRYLAEIANGDIKDNNIQKSMEAYQKATTIANRELDTTNYVRLGLALNFSVFYYEIMGEPEKACHVARVAFENAISKIDDLHKESYIENNLILQLLRDNLTLWTTESDNEPEEAGRN